MKHNFNEIKTIFLFPLLIMKFLYYWILTDTSKLPGKEFARYGIKIGIKLLLKLRISPKLLLNPVSIVRYFEFDYVLNNLKIDKNSRILDISSPYLFGFYLIDKTECKYKYINPDIKDLANVNSLAKKLKFGVKYLTECLDVESLNKYPENYFDNVISISVIEHIANDGDSIALKEMWRVLKISGRLIVTFPVAKQYEEQFKTDDIYNLQKSNVNNNYFFKRSYDEKNINKRLLSSIDNYKILNQIVFGDATGRFYNEYTNKWNKYGLSETVKDPYYITKYFKNFSKISELPGMGVIGLTLKKLK